MKGPREALLGILGAMAKQITGNIMSIMITISSDTIIKTTTATEGSTTLGGNHGTGNCRTLAEDLKQDTTRTTTTTAANIISNRSSTTICRQAMVSISTRTNFKTTITTAITKQGTLIIHHRV